jgi:hypothetical protein
MDVINYFIKLVFLIEVHFVSCISEVIQKFLLIKIAAYFVSNQASIIKSFHATDVYNRPVLRIKSTPLVFTLEAYIQPHSFNPSHPTLVWWIQILYVQNNNNARLPPETAIIRNYMSS